MQLDQALEIHGNADLLFDQQAVEQGIVKLASKVAKSCENDFPLLLCVMNGGLY